MDEPKAGNQDTSPKSAEPTLQQKEGIAPDTTTGTPTKPTTYTEEQVKKTVNDALVKAGRDAKSFEKWQKSLEDKEAQIASTQEKVSQLEKDLEELAQDDPDRKNVLTKIKAQQDKETKLEADRKVIEADKEALKADKEKWGPTLRSHLSKSIAEEFDGADPARLKALADRHNLNTEEEIREEAATLWQKKSDKSMPLIDGTPDSGMTRGGGINFDSLTPDQKILWGLTHPKK